MVAGVISVLLNILGFVAKNPIVGKIALFGVFYGLLTLVITQVKDYLFPYFQNLSSLSANIAFILCKIDFLGALNLYVSALLAIFVLKQILGYVKG